VALVCAALIGGCRADPGPATTLTLAIDGGPASLDPRLGSDEASKRVNELLYNALFRLDAASRPAPDLAESYEAPDARTVAVTLRPGVLFHDGAPLTSRDVVYTYRSILDDEVPSFRKADLEALAAIEAPDERTVVFRLRRPFAPILTNLNIPILKAGAGPRAAARPIGTGPFRLVRYRKDEDLVLGRFDRHFAGAGGVETVRLRIIPSETVRLLELLKGSVDLVVNDLSPDQVARVRRTPGYRVESRPGRNCVYMAFNLADPLVRDRRVREAIARGIDRPAIVRHLLHGAATLATGLLPPGHWAHEPDVPRYEPDPGAARRLLDEAGLPDPDGEGRAPRLRLSYKTSTSELSQQQAAILQEQLARVGIALEIRAYEWPTFYDDLKAGRFQVVVSNWTEISDPDVYRLRFHSRHRPPAGFNRGGYDNPVIDRLIERGAATLDEAERRRIYGAVQRLLAHDLPYVVLWHRDVTAAMRERVRGFRLTPGADFHPLREVTLDGPATAPGGDGTERGSGQPAPQGPLELGEGDGAGAHDARRIGGQVEDRRCRPAARRAAVEDQGHLLAQGLLDLAGRLRRRLAGAVGAGGDDRPPGGARQGPRDGVRRDADADGRSAPEQARRQVLRRGEDQGQGPRPERRGEPTAGVGELAVAGDRDLGLRGDQGQGHPLRPPLRLEHPLDRLGVARVGRQPVEGLGRVRHEPARAQMLGRPRDQDGIGSVGIDALQAPHGSSAVWEGRRPL
jgi:peptide/nickel transport system substrate-binding protein